jgi:hypothetical protein
VRTLTRLRDLLAPDGMIVLGPVLAPPLRRPLSPSRDALRRVGRRAGLRPRRAGRPLLSRPRARAHAGLIPLCPPLQGPRRSRGRAGDADTITEASTRPAGSRVGEGACATARAGRAACSAWRPDRGPTDARGWTARWAGTSTALEEPHGGTAATSPAGKDVSTRGDAAPVHQSWAGWNYASTSDEP